MLCNIQPKSGTGDPLARSRTKKPHIAGSFIKKGIKLFKPFGCTTMIYIPLGKRTKLDVTAVRGMLIGVAEGMLCYKSYCNERKRIIHARDVPFIVEPDERLFINND